MMALNNLGRLLEMTGPKEMTEPEALYRRVLEKEPRFARPPALTPSGAPARVVFCGGIACPS